MMTFTTSRSTTSRSIAAAAAVAAASTLAACGSSDSTTAADVPAISSSSSASPSSTSQTPSSSASATSSSTTSAPTTSAPKPAATKNERASRSQQRQALPAAAPAVTYVNWTQVESVPRGTSYVYSANLPKGTSEVTTAGAPGAATVTYRTAKQGAKVVSTTEIGSTVTKAAVRRVVTIGTGGQSVQRETQTPQVSRSQTRRAVTQQAAPARRSAPSSSVGGGSSRSGYWNNVASCESGNNWSINTGNGFYGGLQFTQQTWAGYGGLAYAPRADLASASQQMAIADKVLASQGPGAWPVCHTRG